MLGQESSGFSFSSPSASWNSSPTAPNLFISATGGTAPNAWLLSGNPATTAGANFLGTTDDQPLELKVFGQRALRLESGGGLPNIIAGASDNKAAVLSYGTTISDTPGKAWGSGWRAKVAFTPASRAAV